MSDRDEGAAQADPGDEAAENADPYNKADSGSTPSTPIDSIGVDRMLAEEMTHLGFISPEDAPEPGRLFDHIHRLRGDRRPTALCLSGGGIRSATFSLGVLQSFAASNRLGTFHYLSTVSGGGYTGSFLSSWLAEAGWQRGKVFDLLRDQPQLSAMRQSASAIRQTAVTPIARLRAYSNYLSPLVGLSIDSLSLVSIFIRNLLLNLLVWVPLIAALVLWPRLFIALLDRPSIEPNLWVMALAAVSTLLVIGGLAFIVADLPGHRQGPQDKDVQPLPLHVRDHFFKACFLPVTLAAMLLALACSHLSSDYGKGAVGAFLAVGASIHLIGAGIGTQWRRQRGLTFRGGPGQVASIVMLLLGGALGGCFLWSTHQYVGLRGEETNAARLLYATIAVPVMLGCFWLTMSLYAGAVSRWTSEEDREWWAKATAWWLYASLAWTLLFGVVVYLPALLLEQLSMELSAGAQVGIAGGALGMLTSAVGYWGKRGADIQRRAEGFLSKTGLRLLDALAALVLLAALVGMSLALSQLFEHCHSLWPALCPADLHAQGVFLRNEALLQSMDPPAIAVGPPVALRSGESLIYEQVLMDSPMGAVLACLVVCTLFSWAVSYLIGANAFSLHGMYGNRLVRAYLGAVRLIRDPHWFSGFDPKDNVPLASLDQAVLPPQERRLFHVVNIALNLVKPSVKRLSAQQRKAGSFTATPLRAGADGVGFVPTAHYGSGKGMTLGRAFTISGAAASPNMGYHSSPLVTLVMTLFNVRLGWWLPNPGPRGRKLWAQDGPQTAFRVMLDEAFGRTTDDRAAVYLSDGGHFDNLGLYEMVRRRCHRIVVVDGTADPEFKYADLLNTVRKIRIDFGIPIELPSVLPGPGRTTAHPRRIVARIRYSARDGGDDAQDGFLFLIKPRLLGTEPPDVLHYAADSLRPKNAFPHQSTADQFFDEDQFESYRMLGVLSAKEAFSEASEFWPELDPLQQIEPPPGKNDDKDDDRKPPGLISELGEQMGNMSRGAVLATALAVGGTAGVVGTATVGPDEVRLTKEDRQLVEEITSPRAPSRPAKDADPPLVFDPPGYGGASSRSPATPVPPADLQEQIDVLTEQIRRLNQERASDRVLLQSQITALTERVQTLNAVFVALERNQVQTQTQNVQLISSFGTLNKALDDLKRAVENTPPDRHIRSQGR